VVKTGVIDRFRGHAGARLLSRHAVRAWQVVPGPEIEAVSLGRKLQSALMSQTCDPWDFHDDTEMPPTVAGETVAHGTALDDASPAAAVKANLVAPEASALTLSIENAACALADSQEYSAPTASTLLLSAPESAEAVAVESASKSEDVTLCQLTQELTLTLTDRREEHHRRSSFSASSKRKSLPATPVSTEPMYDGVSPLHPGPGRPRAPSLQLGVPGDSGIGHGSLEGLAVPANSADAEVSEV
jgi:hypothetical protein